MTVFFSVDVETTGLNPFRPEHQLISVGALAVSDDGLIGDRWYDRLDRADTWDPDTREWWLKQNATAKREAFADGGTDPRAAALDFVAWVNDTTDHAVFVANPSTFDFGWILRWLTEADVDMPFDYRTMCLRSADWGRNPGPWGLERNGHRPIVSHHALHDAQAQALDLLDLLGGAR
jgi:hypothetical protein